MPAIEIRPTLPADISSLLSIPHSYQTTHVWQMDRLVGEGQVNVNFHEIRLPRPVHVEYPRPLNHLSQEGLQTSVLLSALLAGEPVGYVRIKERMIPRTIWIADIAIREDLRRQGIASALILAAHDWAVEHGHRQSVLEMQSKNFPGLRMATRLGYEFCGYNDHFYLNQDIALFFSYPLR
ncbi:MAG: GNAT family N-acetyltransferase [Anaerolineae bacterium]|nr:GNAT family N-acetyltransferase [Anaerolineae bacterium]